MLSVASNFSVTEHMCKASKPFIVFIQSKQPTMRSFWMKRETIRKASRPHGISNKRVLDMVICMNKQYEKIHMEIGA